MEVPSRFELHQFGSMSAQKIYSMSPTRRTDYEGGLSDGKA